MRFKAVCTDIDGTLLDSRRELSEGTLAAFKRLPSEVPVILASSRMPGAMRHLQRELGILHHPLICYNGGYLIHFANGTSAPHVYDSVAMPLPVCKGIIGLAAGTSIHVSLYANDLWYAPVQDQWTEREARITKVAPTAITSLQQTLELWEREGLGAHKVMCMGPEQEINVMEQELNKQFGEVIHIYRSRTTYLEIAPKAISKATGLQLILQKHYQLSLADVISFGDNYNDIELLKQSGWGVAVANARDEVKAVANEITLDNKEDGVAVVLNHYFA